MEKSESIKNLAIALSKFQGTIGKIGKDSNNPFFKSKYASLSTILENIQKPLTESGLCFSQMPDQTGLTSILIHSESGEYIQATYVLTPVKNDPQSLGSAITYARRYALGSILGLNIDEDDDANKASTPDKKQEPKKTENKPLVNDKAFEKAIERMQNGEKDLLVNLQKYFTLSQAQIDTFHSLEVAV